MNDVNSNPGLTAPESQKATQPSAITIAITSGKGGVGKTNISTNLGIELAKAGKKVCVFDADTSLANINILLNLTPKATLEHLLRDELPLEDILLEGPHGLKIVPAATGIADFILLNEQQQDRLLRAIEQLEHQFDYILIDTAAGIGDSVLQFVQSALYAVVVISPEPTSLTDAFALIKVLQKRGYDQPLYVLVNMTDNYNHSMEVYRRFAHAVNKYIHLKVRYLGYIPTDKAIQKAVLSQTPVSLANADSPAARCFTLLGSLMMKHLSAPTGVNHKQLSQFWRQQRDLVPEPSASVHEAQEPATETTPAVDLARFSQAECENLLSELIQHYLVEYGELPAQAIDLSLQAYAQEQLTDEGQNIVQHLSLDNLPPRSESSPTRGALIEVKSLEEQIEQLVADAEKSKEALTRLTQQLNLKYRALYQKPLPSTPGFTAPKHGPRSGTAAQDKLTLLQSAYFASAVDSVTTKKSN